jgi:heat shock protein HslJ
VRARLALTVVLLLGLSGLLGCGSDSSDSGGKPAETGDGAVDKKSSAGLTGIDWQLDGYDGPGGDVTVPAAPAAPATLVFDPKGTLKGSTGCNQFSGTYTVDGSDLAIELGAVTQAACANAVLTAQETAILERLPRTATFTVDAERLTLTGADDAPLLTYEPGLADLADTSWKVTGVNNGAGAVVTSAETENLTAVFGPDGAFSGNGGCNQLAATYETDADGLTIEGVTSTKRACEPAVDAMEAQYITALEKVTTYEISGNRLTLRDDAGSMQVTLQLAT